MKLILFWKPVVWLIVICYLSLMPGNNLPMVPLFEIPHFDKLVHMGFYFILSIFLIKPVSEISSAPNLFTFLAAGLISGLIEILQDQLAISRHGNIYDFLANLAGIIIALIFYRLFILNKKTEHFF